MNSTCAAASALDVGGEEVETYTAQAKHSPVTEQANAPALGDHIRRGRAFGRRRKPRRCREWDREGNAAMISNLLHKTLVQGMGIGYMCLDQGLVGLVSHAGCSEGCGLKILPTRRIEYVCMKEQANRTYQLVYTPGWNALIALYALALPLPFRRFARVRTRIPWTEVSGTPWVSAPASALGSFRLAVNPFTLWTGVLTNVLQDCYPHWYERRRFFQPR